MLKPVVENNRVQTLIVRAQIGAEQHDRIRAAASDCDWSAERLRHHQRFVASLIDIEQDVLTVTDDRGGRSMLAAAPSTADDSGRDSMLAQQTRHKQREGRFTIATDGQITDADRWYIRLTAHRFPPAFPHCERGTVNLARGSQRRP